MIPSLRHVDEAEMVRFGLLRAAVRQENAYRRAGAKCRRCQLHARRVLLRVADLERGEASLYRELLAHPFAAVTRDRVRDLVTDDRREPRVVTRDRQDAAVDHDLAAREAKRIDLLVLEDLELPLVVGASGRGGDSSSDARHLRIERWVGRDLGLADGGSKRRDSQLLLVALRHDHELVASRPRDGGTREDDTEGEHENCRGDARYAGAHAESVARLVSDCAVAPASRTSSRRPGRPIS